MMTDGEFGYISRRINVGACSMAVSVGSNAGADRDNRFFRRASRAGVSCETGAHSSSAYAGRGVDIAVRRSCREWARQWAADVVDNRPGAGGNIAAELGARDGARRLYALRRRRPAAISQTLYPKLSYDVLRDFEMVALIASVSQILVVHPSLPARTVKEFVAIAKSRRGELAYASTGSGSTPHLAAEMLRMQAGIEVLHVPYRGTPPALTDLLAGNVTFMFANILSVLPHVQSGRLRALAITARSAAHPAGCPPSRDHRDSSPAAGTG